MNQFDKANSSAFLRKFLIAPEYRAARHLLLIFIMVVTALNQSFMTMRDGIEKLGNGMLIQSAFIFITYLAACYFNLWVLLPRYLLQKKYVRYALYLSATVLLLILVQTLEERAMLIRYDILDGFYTMPRIFITIISSFALVLLCVSGIGMTVLLKHWLLDNRKMNQLEKLHIQSEVEQLKEQVNPRLLFSILNRTGVLASQCPEEASDMLIKLSQLLRYQLYDCNRERVLLSAEIKFLSNYLTLEQMYSGMFTFDIQADKGCSHILVSPLLFISFVQSAIGKMYETGRQTAIAIRFETTDDTVTFCCRCQPEEVFFDMDFSKVCKRLDFLYGNRHTLTVTGKEVILNLEI
ncbi:sensor histidine kinase [Bacteroides sp.]|uniref:sensor histidine kinase n=1 Tax=Bacteroides sp. TaxID=29523 RepID=UPI003AB5DDD5